jgi:Na+/H+ antiporter NhaD/arsenite permease-like protein
MLASIKWYILSVALTVCAVAVYFIGYIRKNRIDKRVTDIPEEAEGNRIAAQKLYVKHSVVTFALLLIAFVIYFAAKKGAGA